MVSTRHTGVTARQHPERGRMDVKLIECRLMGSVVTTTMNKTFHPFREVEVSEERRAQMAGHLSAPGPPRARQQSSTHTTTDRHGAMTHFSPTHIKCVCSGYLA